MNQAEIDRAAEIFTALLTTTGEGVHTFTVRARGARWTVDVASHGGIVAVEHDSAGDVIAGLATAIIHAGIVTRFTPTTPTTGRMCAWRIVQPAPQPYSAHELRTITGAVPSRPLEFVDAPPLDLS